MNITLRFNCLNKTVNFWRHRSSTVGITFIGFLIFLLFGGNAVLAEDAQKNLELEFTPLSAQTIEKPFRVHSLGKTDQYFRLTGKPGKTRIKLPLKTKHTAHLLPDSLRLFRLDQKTKKWKMVSDSKYLAKRELLTATISQSGLYTVIGASRFEEVFRTQWNWCKAPRVPGIPGMPDQPNPICQLIDCPAGGFQEISDAMASEFPFPIGPDVLGGVMGGICQECTGGRIPRIDFPECSLPGLKVPVVVIPDLPLYRWPFRPFSFNASNGCKPGPYKVGKVDYNFEDEFDLIPPGSTSVAYPNVDVRATVRYPSQSIGTGTPLAGTTIRYPLVVFLHGNHATCSAPCSGSKTCPVNDRVPNHKGYNYLLDILASWGFIAVSIDGFDVTAAWSSIMSDYEARGRLVLRHLEKWKSWSASGSDPWGGLFNNRVNMNKISLSGHSRGGEGVVAAEYFNRVEGHGFAIKAINAIAPTDQDPGIRYVPQVPYFLLLAASDGDVSNLQGLRTYDRTSLEGALVSSEKSMLWVYGANHNFFNTSWTPESGVTCSFNDGAGYSGRLAAALQRRVACQSIVPFFRLHLQNLTGYRKLFRGEVLPEGLDGVEMYWAYQNPLRMEVDNFDSGDNPNTNSLGGPVTTSGGFTPFDEAPFGGAGSYNGSFYHKTSGLVLGWNAVQSYETVLPAAHRDVSTYSALSLRISQILDNSTLNKLDTPRTFKVSLKTGTGEVSNQDFDVAGIQSNAYPYEDNGGKTVLTTLRIPLNGFRNGNRPFSFNNIESIKLEFKGTGLIAIDDIQFTK